MYGFRCRQTTFDHGIASFHQTVHEVVATYKKSTVIVAVDVATGTVEL